MFITRFAAATTILFIISICVLCSSFGSYRIFCLLKICIWKWCHENVSQSTECYSTLYKISIFWKAAFFPSSFVFPSAVSVIQYCIFAWSIVVVSVFFCLLKIFLCGEKNPLVTRFSQECLHSVHLFSRLEDVDK